MVNTCLFHNDISQVPRFYLAIHRETLIRTGAEPYIVIPLAVPLKVAVVFQQYFADFLFVFRHCYATTACRSILKLSAILV